MKKTYNKTLLFCHFWILPFLLMTFFVYAADKVEFSLDGDNISEMPSETISTQSIDSSAFDRAFVDPKIEKKKKELARKKKMAKIKKVKMDNAKEKATAVAVPAKQTSLPASSPKTNSAESGTVKKNEDYLQKVIKVVKKGYEQGSALVYSWANKLKMKWQESGK